MEAFVMTSSLAATISHPNRKRYKSTEKDWNNWAESIAQSLGDKAEHTILYPASKAAAEKALWKFRDQHNVRPLPPPTPNQSHANPPSAAQPDWSIVAINPGVVAGPPIQPPPSPTALNETLKPYYSLFTGATATVPPIHGIGSFVDIRDVTAMHVWCVEHAAQCANQRFLVVNGRVTPQAAADVLRKAYPERECIPVGRPGEGYESGYGWPEGGMSFCGDKVRRILGREYIGFEQSVVDTAKVFERISC